jgi:molecular chaperone DnaK
MTERARIVGIDLGTTNTCVASVRNRLAKVVPTDRGNLILPSVVGLSSRGDLLVGAVAKDQQIVNPRNTIHGAKRLIGRPYESRTVQDLRGHYAYDIVPGEDGGCAVRLGDRVYSLPEVSGFVLGHVKAIAEQFLGGPVDEAVISVPAYYNDAQRAAVKRAGQLAGFRVRRLVNEPTAAALAYGFNRGLDQRILVYDLGGGTFDVSVLQLSGNVFEVIACGGDTFLGGTDFDNRIVEWVLAEFKKAEKIDLAENPIALQRIKGAAEAAKIDLSLVSNAVIELPYIVERRGKPLDLRIPLSRERLNSLTHDLVDRTFEICDRVLAEQGLSGRDIREILLVGGQSRMPLVQQRIEAHFGRPARKGVHPDECVAQGAALLADSLDQIDAVTLLDALSMPIGLASSGARFRPILPKNARIPVVKGFRLPSAREGLREITLDVFQGEGDRIADNEWLGSVSVPAHLAGRKIEFRLTEECLLEVLVDVPGEGPKPFPLSTRVLPDALRAARLEESSRSEAPPPAEEPAGFFRAIRRVFGGG